jgi:hypothetical protein
MSGRHRDRDAFFVDVNGCALVFEVGPFKVDDDWMKTQVDVHPGKPG